MKLLLDTHIWLWSLIEPDRLGKRTAAELRNSENELWLSPISSWEALVLHEKKRVFLDDDAAAWIARNSSLFREAPITHAVASRAALVPMPQRDPADRFLAATAYVLGLTLLTADTKLLGLGDIATLANR